MISSADRAPTPLPAPDEREAATGDMPPHEFRRYGHQVVEWIAAYFARLADYPVLAQVAPGAIRQALPPPPPSRPEAMESILADVERVLMVGITHWNAPGFMAYFGLTGSGPAILAEMMAAALNVNAMLWRTSPAATELEQVTLDWLRQMLGLPQEFFGLLHDSSSGGSILAALAAAREAIPDLHIRQQGLAGRPDLPRLRFYASQEAHSSVEKAAILLGLGQEGLRKIGVDGAFRMDVGELERAIAEDLAAGLLPFAVVATAGTTSTTSVDPLPQIANLCERYGLWLHVDAAYGGCAAVVPQIRPLLSGWERADSLSINPYKWLFTTLGGSVLFTRKPNMFKSAFSLVPDYLAAGNQEGVVNLMDYSPALTHRFLALKLWMVLRYFGQQGLAARIHEHIRLAHLLAGWVDESADFERLAPTPFSTVCLRAHPAGMDDENILNSLNEAILNRINAAGRFFLSSSRLHGKYTIRVAIGSLRTTEDEVRHLWHELQQALAAQRDRPSPASPLAASQAGASPSMNRDLAYAGAGRQPASSAGADFSAGRGKEQAG